MTETNVDIVVDEGAGREEVVEDVDSETTSLKSTITNYRYENGRRYHAYKAGSYWGPNDEQAQEHLDIFHHLCLLTFDNQLYLAPLEMGIQKVLDLGTGTGMWAIDFADQHPTTQVIGTDLSPIQPSYVPPNVKFEIDDVEDEWTYPRESLDYIHIRSMFGCVADWPRLYQQVLQALKPGGWFEQLEMAPCFDSDDSTVCEGRPIHKWGQLGLEAGSRIGKESDVMWHMKSRLHTAGFEDIHEVKVKWPLGPWAKGEKQKQLGQWARLHVEEGLEVWGLAVLTRVMGWTVEETNELIESVRKDLRDRKIHAWHEMRVVYGRKPNI